VRGVKQQNDNAQREAALYLSVKPFFERQGYEVKAEVRGCDLVARRAAHPSPSAPAAVAG
jgi:hypothetical protein